MGTTPQMALVKVVSDELTALMGAKGAKDLEQGFPQIVLMAGLQVWGREAERGEGKDSSGWFVGQRCCCEELLVVSRLPHPPPAGCGQDHCMRQAGPVPEEAEEERAHGGHPPGHSSPPCRVWARPLHVASWPCT